MSPADDDGLGTGTPQLLRVEDPWPPGGAGFGLQLRVWRLDSGRLAVMFADYTPADDRLVPLVGQILAEYPADSIDFFYEEVLNPLSMGYFASLTLGNDGRLAETALDGPGVTALYEMLGPTLGQTSRPEDDRPLWGGP